MVNYLEELDRMLETDGGFEASYKSLELYSAYRLESARTSYPRNKELKNLEAMDIVHYAFIRLMQEGAGDKKPYYALRNFAANRIRVVSKLARVKREVPVGGDEEEWAIFWENVSETNLANPAQVAENHESVDDRTRLFCRLRADFNNDECALQLLDSLECEYYTRKEIIENSNLTESTYDAAIKRIRRKVLKYKKVMSL